jgi:DNA-directed RNA polymerase specialized sigma24 family protein
MGNSPTAHQEEVIASIAARVARRYVRRASWSNEDDLYHEALVTAYEARESWTPSVGVPFQAYAWQACLHHLKRFVWNASAPVRLTDWALRHNLQPRGGGLELADDLPDPQALADELVIEHDWLKRLRDQLLFLFFEHRSELEGQVAVRVVLDEDPPRVVARELGLPVTQVYRIARRARLLLEQNAVLFDLWKERTDEDGGD